MAGNRVQQKVLANAFRSFRRSTIFCESKASETLNSASKDVVKKEKEEPVLPESKNVGETPLGPLMYTPKPLDKWLLVWFKKYKSINDIPVKIRQETMAHIHSKSRIRIANILIILALFGCVWAVWSGKESAASGDSIQKRIIEKHKQSNLEYLTSLEKKSKSM